MIFVSRNFQSWVLGSHCLFSTPAQIGAIKKFFSSGTGGGATPARSNRSPFASQSLLYLSQSCLPRQFSSVISRAIKLIRPAKTINRRRTGRQLNSQGTNRVIKPSLLWVSVEGVVSLGHAST